MNEKITDLINELAQLRVDNHYLKIEIKNLKRENDELYARMKALSSYVSTQEDGEDEYKNSRGAVI